MRPLLKCMLLLVLAGVPAMAFADVGDASKLIGTALTLYGAFTGNAALLKWGAALMFAGNVAGSIESRRKAKQMRARQIADFNAGLQARNISLPTAEPPHRCGYGRCLTGGDVLAIFTTDKTGVREDGSTYTKPDALQHVVLHFQTRQAHAIHEVFIDNVPVGALDGSGIPTGGAFVSSATVTRTVQFTTSLTLTEPALAILTAWTQVGDSPEPRTVTISGGGLTLTGPTGELVTVDYTVAMSAASVRISKFLGSPTQAADAYLQSVVPSKWTANHRLRGMAGIVITLDLEDPRFQGGLPNITAEGSWARVYDPRKDSSVPSGSGTHRADDPSTWEWSDNNALCAADWLASEMGYGVSMAEDINAAYLIAAANACDATISLDDGAGAYSGKRYTCNGAFTSEDNREQVLQDLEDSMAGVAVPAGQWCLMAGAWTPPVGDLGDADLAGGIEVLQADTGTDDLINSARGRYIAAGKSQPSDANPPYSNPTLVTADQGEKLWGSYSYPFTSSNARVRNLLRINVERKRSGLTIQYPAKLRHWGKQVGERVYVTSSTYVFERKPFRITDRRTTHQAPVIFTLQEDAAEIWDEADAATADPTPNTGLPDPYTVAPVASLAATSGTATLLRTADGTVAPQVEVTWAAIADAYVVPRGRVLVRWRRNGSVAWVSLPPLQGDATKALISGVEEADNLTIEVRVRNQISQLSVPAFIGHVVVGKSALPANVLGLSTGALPGGVLVTVTPSTEADVRTGGGLEVRHGASWAAGTRIFQGPADRFVWPWPVAGSYTLRARWFDSSGNYSAADATASVTVGNGNLIGTGEMAPSAATELVSARSAGLTYSFVSTTGGFEYRVQRVQQISWTNTQPGNVEVELTGEIGGTRSAGPGSVWLGIDSQASSALTSGVFSSLSADTLHTDATSGARRYTLSDSLTVAPGATIYLALTVYIFSAVGTTTSYSGDGRIRIVAIKR